MAKIKAELITNMGDDLLVVNSARVSFNKESSKFTYRDEVPKGSDEGLVKYLATHNHWTPFSHVRYTFIMSARHLKGAPDTNDLAGVVVKSVEGRAIKVRQSLYGWATWIKKGLVTPAAATEISNTLIFFAPECSEALGIFGDPLAPIGEVVSLVTEEDDPDYIDVTLRETVPIFVARQRFKHVVGFTYNEVSRRYVDDEPEFYTPDSWRSRPDGSVKQGSGSGAVTSIAWNYDPHSGEPTGTAIEEVYEEIVDTCEAAYNNMLASGVAPELARMVLPQSMMTSYYVTGSLSAFARMVKQRKDSHAQKEIQDLANMVDEIIRPLYPVSWEALVDG